MGYLKPLWFVVAFVLFQCDSIHSKSACELKDSECVTNALKKLYKRKDFIEVISTLESKTTDGHFEHILSYELANLTMYGMENCEVNVLKFSGEKETNYQYDIFCPKLDITYGYEIKGKVDPTLHAEGLGSGIIDNCFIFMKGNSEIYNSEKDQKSRLRFKDIQFDIDLKGRFIGTSDKVTRGDERQVKLVETAANSMGKILEIYARNPVLKMSLKVFLKKINKYLADFPLEEIFVKDDN